jgi:predicted HTH transcriptional regulator
LHVQSCDESAVVLEVPISNQRPVSLRDGGVSKVFVRIGASTHVADGGMLVSIEVEASPRSQDSIVDRNNGLGQEQIEWLCARLTKRRGDQVTVSDLVSLGLLVPEGGGYLPTSVFVFLTDNQYPNAFIQCAWLIGHNETEFSEEQSTWLDFNAG